jgi:pyridoxal/pyridoxine/pyridoxamine kinase
MNPKPVFTGIAAALVTFFDEHGHVDNAATAKHATHLASRGVRAVVVAGSTGEASHLSMKERLQLLKAVKAAVPAHVPVILGTGDLTAGVSVPNLTRRAADSARRAQEKETAAEYLGHSSVRESLVGNSDWAKQDAQSAIAQTNGKHGEGFSAIAFAFTGDSAQAKSSDRQTVTLGRRSHLGQAAVETHEVVRLRQRARAGVLYDSQLHRQACKIATQETAYSIKRMIKVNLLGDTDAVT